MQRIFKKKIGIEGQVDEFLNQVSDGGVLCQNGIDAYLRGDSEAFAGVKASIWDMEHRGDFLRRDIEKNLYQKTLIPESRGDVMRLLEDMDTLLDRFKGLISQFEIEQPEIYPEFHEYFKELLHYSVESVEATVCSCRAFFNDVNEVDDYIHKISFWEKESDKASTMLQKTIFGDGRLSLSQKMHLRYFAKMVDRIADDAEHVGDRLNIYVIKRML